MSVFLIQKIKTDSVNHADSGDIKTFVHFSGSPILKILLNFWNCVGGTLMRGYFILKITVNVNLITVIIFVYNMRVLIWFRLNLRNFNPRNFQFLVGFSFKTIFAPSPTTTTFISKDAEFLCAPFDTCEKFAACCPLPNRPRKCSK